MGAVLKNIVKDVIVIFLTFFFNTYGFSDDNRKDSPILLSLAEAANLAFKNNKDILIQENEVKIAHANLLASQSEFLPKLNLVGGYTHREAILNLSSLPFPIKELDKDLGIFLGFKDEKRLGLTLDQPLYKGGRNFANWQQAKLKLKTKKEFLRAQKLAIEFQTKRLYYGFWLAGETENIAQKLVDRARSHYQDVQKKYAAGTVSRFDALQSKVQLSKVIPQLIKARNAKELIAKELKKLLGLKMNSELDLSEQLIYSPIKVKEKEFLAQADQNNPELVIKTLGLDIGKQSVSAAAAGYRPQLGAGFNYDYRSDDWGDMFNSRHSNWNATVSVNMPIFDGFSAKAKVDEAQARYRQAELGKEDLTEQIALEVSRTCLDLSQAQAIIDSQKDSVDEAKEALKIAEISYANGEGTNLVLLDAQVSLSQIEKNLSEAIYDYMIARYYLDKIIGKKVFLQGE